MNMDYLVYDFMNSMIEQMLSSRMQEMIQKENPPFAFAEVSSGSYLISKTKDAMQFFAVSNPNSN